MIVTAYLDESNTHEDSSIFVLAGFVGHAGAWHKFEKKWKRLLIKYGVEYFHAKEISKQYTLEQGWSRARKNEFFRETDKLAHQYSIFSFISSVRRSDYEAIYKVRDKKRPKGMTCPDSMYGVCFRHCLSVLPVMLKKALGEKEVTLHVVMEDGHKNVQDAVRVFTQFKKYPDAFFQNILGTITIAEKKECYGIQAADSLAYAGYMAEKLKMPVVTHHLNRHAWANSKLVASTQGKNIRPCFALKCEEKILEELKIKLLSTVKPKGRGVLLYEQEKLARASAQQLAYPMTKGTF